MPESDIPFFLGGKQGTIEPNSLACRLLGITLRKQSFTNADKAWDESKSMIDQDIPLLLRVDIAYMPYEGFDEEMEEVHARLSSGTSRMLGLGTGPPKRPGSGHGNVPQPDPR